MHITKFLMDFWLWIANIWGRVWRQLKFRFWQKGKKKWAAIATHTQGMDADNGGRVLYATHTRRMDADNGGSVLYVTIRNRLTLFIPHTLWRDYFRVKWQLKSSTVEEADKDRWFWIVPDSRHQGWRPTERQARLSYFTKMGWVWWRTNIYTH